MGVDTSEKLSSLEWFAEVIVQSTLKGFRANFRAGRCRKHEDGDERRRWVRSECGDELISVEPRHHLVGLRRDDQEDSSRLSERTYKNESRWVSESIIQSCLAIGNLHDVVELGENTRDVGAQIRRILDHQDRAVREVEEICEAIKRSVI